MDDRPDRVVLVFLDGVGIGSHDRATNPFLTARLPVLRQMLGDHLPLEGLADEPRAGTADCWWVAADARLGVAGRPQSGTGQTTLLTGVNAAELLGRHFGPWVHTGLRHMLESENLLSRAAAAGRSVAFANAYPPGAVGLHARGGRRPAAPPLAARAAGALTRSADSLRAGRAVASSITNDAWQRFLDPSVPDVTADAAGRNLARIAAEVDLTLFAHYDTDTAGHRQELEGACLALERVDAFLGGLLEDLPPGTLLVVSSDHGNLEDVSVGHTLNPVPVILYGGGSKEVARVVRGIGDVAPALLRLLRIE